MTLGDHFQELRLRVIRSLIAVGVGIAIGMYFGMRIVTWVSDPIIAAMRAAGFEDPKLWAGSIGAPFMVYMRVSLIAGCVLASPYVIWQLWQFVAAGLYPHERRWVTLCAPVTVVLFLAGTAFAYLLAIRVGLQFLAGFALTMTKAGIPIEFKPSLEDSLNLIMMFSVLMGLVFELPVVIVLLSAIGIVGSRALRTFRRYFILAAFIVAAVVTPTVDPLTQTVMAVPLILLYEAGLQAARLIERRRARNLAG